MTRAFLIVSAGLGLSLVLAGALPRTAAARPCCGDYDNFKPDGEVQMRQPPYDPVPMSPPPPPQVPPVKPANPDVMVGLAVTEGALRLDGVAYHGQGLALDLDIKLKKRIYLQGQYQRSDLANDTDGATMDSGQVERFGLAAHYLLGRRVPKKGWDAGLWLEAGLGRQEITTDMREVSRDDFAFGAALQVGPLPKEGSNQSWGLYLGARGVLADATLDGRDRDRGYWLSAGFRLGW